MPACLVMGAAAFYRRVVLSNVEVDSPRTQDTRHRLQSLLHLPLVFPIKAFGQYGIFWSIISQRIKERVGHVGLEPERLGPIHQFQQLDHSLPAVHATPTNFALGGQAFAVIFGNITALSKGRCDLLRTLRVIGPSFGIGRGIDADYSIRSDSELSESFGNPTCLPTLFDKTMPVLRLTHRGSAAGWRPNRRDHGTCNEVLGSNFVRELL